MVFRLSVDAAQVLALGRVVVFGIWLFTIVSAPLTIYSELPFDLFEALGPFRFLPDAVLRAAVSPVALTSLKAVLVVGCALLVLGVRPYYPIALTTAGLLLLCDGLVMGFNGFINHAQLGPLYAALIIAVFPAADALSVMGATRRPAFPGLYSGGILAVSIVLCFAYSFVGVHRLVNGGLAIFQGDAIITWMAVRSLQEGSEGFQYGLLPLDYRLLIVPLKIGYFVTTIFEILAPLCLVAVRFRWLWLAVIVPFHFMTLVTMNIFFWENVLLLLVFIGGLPYALTSAKPAMRDEHEGDRSAAANGAVVFFDGVCNLCNRYVLFVIDRDPKRYFSFASLQSETARAMLRGYGVPALDLSSIVLLENERLYVRSSAVLRIARRLCWPWPLFSLLVAVPRPWRDAAYAWISRNRYRWVGRAESCRVPSPELSDRFLDRIATPQNGSPVATTGS